MIAPPPAAAAGRPFAAYRKSCPRPRREGLGDEAGAGAGHRGDLARRRYEMVLGAAQLLFLFNLVWSARRGRPAGDNPWQATTLEWQPAQPPVTVERGPYEYHSVTADIDFTPQWETASQQE